MLTEIIQPWKTQLATYATCGDSSVSILLSRLTRVEVQAKKLLCMLRQEEASRVQPP